MRIRWTPLAYADLRAACEFVRRDNPAAARRLRQAITKAVTGLAAFPMQGRPGRVDGTRELVIAATPFVVVYECIEEEIGIVAVMHGSRAWPEVF